MLFYLTSRIVSSVAAFLYPGYASYKTLSQRPASEEDLERWLMYWSVLGCIVGVEYVAEWIISWIPFYYLFKTVLLLYLALPQTRGSTYIYTNHLHPFFRTHESQIDSLLAQLRAYIYTFLQKQLKTLWEHVGSAVGQQPLDPQHPSAYHPDGAAAQPPQPSTLGGLAGSLWRAYGPGLLANLRPAVGPQRAPLGMDSSAGVRPSYPASSMFYQAGDAAAQAVLQRRRQLEAELAALPAVPSSLSSLALPPSPGSAAQLTPAASPSTTFPGSRSSSAADLVNRPARARVDSGKFEEVEVPSDGEGYDVRQEGGSQGRPAPQARGSWFGWGGGGSPGKGYERVKSD
ncbi:TB2/DP1, HVA22 family-domain-containing protein [Mycena epipterygia]|nr:TB2/DP1, HVA22 family-domain-containing protein [Mycena epipterygia]